MSKRPKKSAAPHRAGFVALVGRPNVGKSTLVNTLLGQKVSIVTPKPQTTRTRIQGILTLPEAQIVLVDTPGLGGGQGALKVAMQRVAGDAAADSDAALVVVEIRGTKPEITPEDRAVLIEARKSRGKIVVAVNKVDKIKDKPTLLPWLQKLSEEFVDSPLIPISAKSGDGLDVLVGELVKVLPESPDLFPADLVTDQAERVLAAELVREQLLLRTQAEVPHSAAVVIEVFEDERGADGKGMCRLEGRIYVERESQKAIVVGKSGRQIKDISTAARKAIEDMLGCKVFLKMTVHVDPDWTRTDRGVRRRMNDSGWVDVR
jgi:GTP-binding protein Era